MSDIIDLPAEISIPESLRSNQPPPSNLSLENLAVDAREMSPSELEDVEQRLGAVKFNRKLVNDLSRIGYDAEKQGITRITNGGLVVGQTAIISALEVAQRGLAEAKTPSARLKHCAVINQLAKTLGTLSLSGSVSQMAKTDSDNSRIRRAAVAKGATMGPSIMIPMTTEVKAS